MDGRRRRGRPRKSWKDNIEEWTGQSMSSLLYVAADRRRWATITAEASVGYPNDAWASRVLIDVFNGRYKRKSTSSEECFVDKFGCHLTFNQRYLGYLRM